MEISLKELINIIQKRKWLIVAIVLIVTIITVVFNYYYVPPVYVADTKLIVKQLNEMDGRTFIDTDAIQSNIMIANTYIEIIKNPVVLDKVMLQIPEVNLSEYELLDKLSVKSVNETLLIHLSVYDFNQANAVKIVNTVARIFKEEVFSIMGVDNIVILNEAKVSDNPSPANFNSQIIVVIAGVVSLIAAVGLAVLREHMDDTLKTEQQTEQMLGLITLATIPKVKKKDYKQQKSIQLQERSGELKYANVRS